MMGKQSLGGNINSQESNNSKLNNEEDNEMERDVDEILMRVIIETSGKAEDILDTWKHLVPDPLNCDIQSIQDCMTNPDLLKNALLSTFSHIKEIQVNLNAEKAKAIKRQASADIKEETKGQCFINTLIFSSDSENEKEVSAEIQCDLSEEEEDVEKEKLSKVEFSEPSCTESNGGDNTADCPNKAADESVYEDCEEEVQQDNIDETGNEDASYDGDASSPESSDTESEEDPSWMVSDADSSGSDYEENKRPSVKEMPKVNFKTSNIKSLGLWLSDNGPVHLNTMCHCKGMCMKNCACRTAGISCSVRCGCKTDKCKWRRQQEVEEDIFDDEEYKEKLRTKKAVLTELDTNKMPEKSLPTPTKPAQQSMDATVFCTPAPMPRPVKTRPDETPCNDVFMTPACRPPGYSTDSSLLTSTAKKRNKKKLFTDAIGPQEL
eukprot:TRINITY_DN22133_c0_g1_i1.p1 TRINITY_DN22133_c0_g1~~TRINITY_DN22133_c0_g1_i1.p1  ORF type:complete len:436 (-),score=133.93 TRINITY_DN22133_c0_g1_i1:120-1427(-)